jgi:hypothetical protein
MVILQNCVDILRGERGACTETCSTSSGNGNQFLFVNVTDIKEEEDPEPATSPLIKTEPTVSSVCVYPVLCPLHGFPK